MPSKLVGLFKTLTWNDFTGQPDPLKPTLDAFTSASLGLPAWSPVNIAGTTDFEFPDNVTVTVTFNAAKSWKRPAKLADAKWAKELLEHEQGHYNITALTARDLFIELMQLKGNTYASAGAALADLKPILAKFGGLTEKINKAYDNPQQTNHGANASQQAAWNAMFKKAFTDPRAPAVSAPDGTAYKVPLLDVLKAKGINP